MNKNGVFYIMKGTIFGDMHDDDGDDDDDDDDDGDDDDGDDDDDDEDDDDDDDDDNDDDDDDDDDNDDDYIKSYLLYLVPYSLQQQVLHSNFLSNQKMKPAKRHYLTR